MHAREMSSWWWERKPDRACRLWWVKYYYPELCAASPPSSPPPPPAIPSPPSAPPQCASGGFCRFCSRVPEALLHVTASATAAATRATDSEESAAFDLMAAFSDNVAYGNRFADTASWFSARQRAKRSHYDNVLDKCFELSATDAEASPALFDRFVKPCEFIVRMCNRFCPSPPCERPAAPTTVGPSVAPSVAPTGESGSSVPSAATTVNPTGVPSAAPTGGPTVAPSAASTGESVSVVPSAAPTGV